MRITAEHSTKSIIDFVRNDCKIRGHGTKKWWADKLGVSQMTLSHWLVGRREPNAAHLSAFYVAYEESRANNDKSVWSNLLWQAYYENRELDPELLKSIALQLVKADGLQSRTWALLSWFFAKHKVAPIRQLEILSAPHWNNKIGWLYESADRHANVEPVRLETPAMVFETAGFNIQSSDNFRLYLERQQTALGRKWFLYDGPLEDIKEQLNWRHERGQELPRIPQ